MIPSSLRKLIMAVICWQLSLYIQAQPCETFPADCPGNIEDARDSNTCINNFILPQEITMQNKLREQVSVLMNEAGKKTNWPVYEFAEAPGSGILSGTTALPYPLRHPYQWQISFIFIVNEDSLHAWQAWYNNDLQNASNKVVDSYKQSGNDLSQDAIRKKYLDSATYYGNQKIKYMTDHSPDYQKAILGGDTKGQKRYEDEMKKYDDRINACIDQSNDKSAKDFSASKTRFDDLQTYKHKNTIAFRNASMIRVSLNVNDYIAIADDEGKKIIKQLSIPACTMGVLLHNNSPDEHEIFGQYLRSPDIAMLLFGKWTLNQDQYHSYHSVYFTDKKNTDDVTVKKIPCDKVQTMVLHVEGSPKYITQFLQSLDMQKLNSLIVKE
ncbi:MAG: hypothetical protein Q8941_06550 [Bacteroidota bacterium]|nr:hypothetical protein [Bacteroidota bacterium]